MRKGVNLTSRGLRNCKASEAQSRDGGMLIDGGMASLLFITGVKILLSSLMLWCGRRKKQAEEGWGGCMRGKIMVRWRFRSLQAHDIKNIDNIRSYGRNKVDVRLGTKILWLCVFFIWYNFTSRNCIKQPKFGQLLLLYSCRHSGHNSFSLPCQSFFRIYIVIYFFFRVFFFFFASKIFFKLCCNQYYI